MNGYKVFLIAWIALDSLLSVASVGRPRKPLEANVAAVSLVLSAGLIACVVLA